MSQKSVTNQTRLYLFYFNGIDKPVKILSTNKINARTTLNNMRHTLDPKYQNSVVVNEAIESLVHGVTNVVINGIKYVWHREKGWLQSA